MRNLCLTILCLLLSGPSWAKDWLGDKVIPSELEPVERQILQAELVLQGSYLGPVDGVWNEEAAVALADYARGLGHKTPLLGDLVPLVQAFQAEWTENGWQVLYFEDTNTSFALPAGLLTQSDDQEVFAWEGSDGGISVSFDLETAEEAMTQHRLIYARRGVDADRYQLLEPALMLTSVSLKDRSHAYLRSDQVDGGFASLVLIANDAQYQRLALIGLSLVQGQMSDLVVPEQGLLAAVLASADGSTVAKPAPQEEPRTRRDLSPKDAQSTGSGFYVNAGNIVTAAHVVHGCKAMSLSDGSPVGVVLADDDLDLAVLSSGKVSDVWLNLLAEVRPRLGETVYALGYPYLGLLNQGLAVTGGNVSAMGGIDPSEVRIMVSAPVQPGNSGGPLVNSHGDVVGVVVSRIDDMSIFDETGTLPQNMNFAVPPAALVEFLQRATVTPTPVTVEDIDISRGLPDEMRDSVVPLFCY